MSDTYQKDYNYWRNLNWIFPVEELKIHKYFLIVPMRLNDCHLGELDLVNNTDFDFIGLITLLTTQNC